ncbi:MAG: cation diffusion facilitator family transporter [Candidatus Bathyarchaeia archaeon]
MQSTEKASYKLRALKISTIAITSVVLVEVILGLAVGSLAILSDGVHASLDALTTFVLLITTRASLKPPDEEHMYGHEKFESVGGLVGGIALIGIGLLIMYGAVLRLMQNASINIELESLGFIAIGYTFSIDFLRVGTFRNAIKSESSTMKAGLYHAVADLSSTVIALLGFGLATLGFYNGDALASIALSILLTYLSVKLVWSSGMELSDAISKDVATKVRKEILSIKGVCRCENLRVRRAGDKTFVEATVQVPDYMSLEEAHALASKIETDIKSSLGNADVTIHIEPLEAEGRTEKLVEKLATEVEGVKEAHEINVTCTGGKLYITLHAQVDPTMSIEKSHEIADKIEQKVSKGIRDVKNITVHIEPFDAELRKGSAVDENEIKEIVYHAMEKYKQTFEIKKIVTYMAEKRRYINIDCSFSGKPSIKDAHELASYIEEKLKEKFAETIVTVHIEPEKK